MALLGDIFDVALLEEHVQEGHIRRVLHPNLDLALLNYSEKCTYEGAWSEVTRECRGLIYNTCTMHVVARPYEKFWNWGELAAPDVDLDAPVTVTDKMDGSLAILFPEAPGSWAIATRGSFTSDQAVHAMGVWLERYAGWEPLAGITCLYEIIFPANRIVVDYGDMDDLVLLGARDIATGEDVDSRILEWPGPSTEVHPYTTLRAALEAPPRPGQEGLVVFFPDSGERVKLKQEDYIAIHRLVFGLTARRVWEHSGVHDLNGIGLSPKQIGIALQMDPLEVQGVIDAAPEGNWMDELLMIVPEEFAAWAIRTHDAIIASVDGWEQEARDAMNRLVNEDGISPLERKDAALLIKEESKELQGALFALLDGKSIRAFAWRVVRPEHETYKAEEGE